METKDVILTPEMVENLKGFLGSDTSESFIYVPKIFRVSEIPKQFWPVYKLRAKNGAAKVRSEDSLSYTSMDPVSGERIEKSRKGDYILETLQEGVLGWKNVFLEDLKTLNIFDPDTMKNKETGYLNESAFFKWNQKIMIEITNAIDAHSKLTEEELTGLDY